MANDLELDQLVDMIYENTKEEFQRLMAYCDSRENAEDGIPMLLVLEDLTDAQGGLEKRTQTGDAAFNALLMIQAKAFLKHLKKDDGPVKEAEAARVLELLAEKYFAMAPHYEFIDEKLERS